MLFRVRRNIDRQTLQGPFCEVSENVVRMVIRTATLQIEDASEDRGS
jgi:hypothetical protein